MQKIYLLSLLVCSLILANNAFGYKYIIRNKTGKTITVFVLNPGRTYINQRPKGDTVSHTAPRETKTLKDGEWFQFETKGLSCIGAVVATITPTVTNFNKLIHYSRGRLFNNIYLIDKGTFGSVDCQFLKWDQCYYIDSQLHCGSKRWKIVDTKPKQVWGYPIFDLQDDEEETYPVPVYAKEVELGL